MAKRKDSSRGLGILILIGMAAAVFLAPAILLISTFGSPHAQKNAFDTAFSNPAAWLGSALFWFAVYWSYQAMKTAGEPKVRSLEEQKKLSEHHIQNLVAGDFPETTLLLGPEEKAYLVEHGVRLYETKGTRVATGAGTRVGRLYIGRSESHSVDKVAEIDTGDLVITNQRLCFNGKTEQRTINLRDIQNIESHGDFFSIASSKRNKKALFAVDNPVLCQVVIRNILNGNFEKCTREGLTDDDGVVLVPPARQLEGPADAVVGEQSSPPSSIPRHAPERGGAPAQRTKRGLREYDEFLSRVGGAVLAGVPDSMRGLRSTGGHWTNEQNKRFHWGGTDVHVGVDIERDGDQDTVSIYFSNYKKDARIAALVARHESEIKQALGLGESEINCLDAKNPIASTLSEISPTNWEPLVQPTADRVLRFLSVLKPLLGEML